MRSREERVQGRWKILAVITGVVLVLLILLAALEGINGHRPAQDRSVTPVVALLSVGVGALLGGVVRAAVDRYASVVESKGMAVALRAEVEAILQLVEARRYLSEVTEYISRLQSPTYTPTLDDVFNIRVSQDYFVVFHALCPKIGLLGPLSGQVVRLYMVGKSLLEDIHTLREIYERARSGDDSLDREELLARSQSVASLFQVISDLGPQVVAALTAYAAHRWWRIVPKSHTRARDGECTESKHNGCHQAQPKKAKPGQRGETTDGFFTRPARWPTPAMAKTPVRHPAHSGRSSSLTLTTIVTTIWVKCHDIPWDNWSVEVHKIPCQSVRYRIG